MVYIRKRIGRRRNFFQKHKVLVLFLVCAGACLLSFLFASVFRNAAPTMVFRPPAPSSATELIPRIQPQKYERIVYPYSVIPGGVRSREELAANMGNDQVVAAHFADFAVSRARMVKMEVTKNVYVSYRIRDAVFWTAKAIKIPEGEALVTDGRDYARARCGNRISVLPQAPVSEEEPEPEDFDIPMLARMEPPNLETLPESRLELREFSPITPYFPAPPPRILPYYYRPLFVVSPSGHIIPEPGTLGLLLVGLAALFIIRFARKN